MGMNSGEKRYRAFRRAFPFAGREALRDQRMQPTVRAGKLAHPLAADPRRLSKKRKNEIQIQIQRLP